MKTSSHEFLVLKLFTRARKEHNELSNSKVARAAGVSCATVRTLLSGRAILPDEFEKLMRWNDISPAQMAQALQMADQIQRRAAA